MRNASRPQILRPDGRRHDFPSLCDEDKATLEEIFLRSVTPDLARLAGWEFKGRNISLVSWFLGIRRFTKGFFLREAIAGKPAIIDGYNVWIRQKGSPTETWIPRLKDGRPHKHGFYKVHPVRPGGPDGKYPHALLIDYALGENPWYHPGRPLKDYVAQVYPDDPDLLLGKAYFGLGNARIFGGYFVLQRAARSDLGIPSL